MYDNLRDKRSPVRFKLRFSSNRVNREVLYAHHRELAQKCCMFIVNREVLYVHHTELTGKCCMLIIQSLQGSALYSSYKKNREVLYVHHIKFTGMSFIHSSIQVDSMKARQSDNQDNQ